MVEATTDQDVGKSGAAIARETNRRLNFVGLLSNGGGASLVFLFALFLAPPTVEQDEFEQLYVSGGILFAVYMAISLPLDRTLSRRPWVRQVVPWLHSERPATAAMRELVLSYPLTFARIAAIFWGIASIVFSLLVATASLAGGAVIALTILLGGLTACTLQYLLVERTIRPVTARALAGGAPPRAAAPGVAARLTMAWALATGVPLLGIVAVAAADLAGGDIDHDQIVGAMLFLAVLATAIGLLTMLVAARSVADPVAGVGRALERVQHGDFEARTPVNDGSEVGRLQAGFNRMVAGLGERERLREAFGTFVDPDLAERVLREGTDLAGEEVEISILFLDVRGFTTLAERSEAQQVVQKLNGLYERVVPIVMRHGGHANKFIGDGMLAVFGAPERHPDHADRAVAAALEIARLVGEDYRGELRVGLGVNSGRVLVGTVGGGGRLDFTVIGDAVNTAARVEAATRQTDDDVLITAATRGLLRGEHGEWVERPPIPLKGKSERVALFAPVAGEMPAP